MQNFPPPPHAFARGNTNPPRKGLYSDIVKLLLVAGAFCLWAQCSNWAFEDSRGLKVNPPMWNSVQLFAGILGLTALLIMPSFTMGFLSFALFWGGGIGSYVYERNQRVPEAARLLTPRHLKHVGLKMLARMGVKVGGRRIVDEVAGPPIVFLGKSRTGQKDTSKSKSVESSKGYLAARELIYDSILRRATDVHLEPKEEELTVRLRIDGVMYPTDPFDRSTGDAVINIFKVLSAMDITERRRPQDGSFAAIMEKREIDFRVATTGTRFGEGMSLRILDQSNSVNTLDELGMRAQVLEKIKELINQPHGMFLSCGPTGAGKSTTLYAALNTVDADENKIITVEDPIEYKMEKVTQIEINQKAGQTFAGSLRSILRQDPDIVMIGEIRDDDTAKVCCQAAATGHMVFSTVHANDSISALYRLIDLGVEPFMLSTAVSAILAQRLARRLCPNCRESYKPSDDFLKKNGLPLGKIKEMFRPPKDPGEQCTNCGGLGYRGRIGVYELFVVTERMRDMIREKVPMSTLKAEARKEGMLYMKEEGLRLVIKGQTSIDELARVVK